MHDVKNASCFVYTIVIVLIFLFKSLTFQCGAMPNGAFALISHLICFVYFETVLRCYIYVMSTASVYREHVFTANGLVNNKLII